MKYIVITTINGPTKAIREFAKWQEWKLVVVGDKKTPSDWCCDGVKYLSFEEQCDLFPSFAPDLPENSYVRKVIGYAYALRNGAEVIFDTDDDNIPYPNAQEVIEGILHGEKQITGRYQSGGEWLNVYDLFSPGGCWPRGFPLQHINDISCHAKYGDDDSDWAVVQFLADIDPDVDAVYRMTSGRRVIFDDYRFLSFDKGTMCPVNSQATLWNKEAFPFLFFPLGVPDRVTDILRGQMATVCLWNIDRNIAFASPVVYQERNEHDLHNDFLQEIPLYMYSELWGKILRTVREKDAVDGFKKALWKFEDLGIISGDNSQAYNQFLLAAGI